ncbi:hypothetical protein [Paraflavitalea speifideaquila]|uniref:hypothetical protein n=1 Tax=Paraflavitalea speifideaquila TaxID=3076558 RepID=UPI0028E1AABB|nr:hypothetical protein [Paraflavitalea speifideiaquila]
MAKVRANAAMQLAYTLWKDTHQKKYEEQLLLIAELSKAQLLADERAARSAQAKGVHPIDSIGKRAARLRDAVIYYQRELAAAPGNKVIPDLLQTAEYELSLLNKTGRVQARKDTAEEK